MFLFPDSPDETIDPLVRAHPQVTVFAYEDLAGRLWQQQGLYGYLREFIPREVMARQLLNVQVAVARAYADGLDWILHIDMDELFYPGGTPVAEHFARVEQSGADVVKYWNHEGVTEDFFTRDPFREMRLFKKNENVLEFSQRLLIKQIWGKQPYFSFYNNGKAAARVHKHLVPQGVHSFYGKAEDAPCASPCILHFACGGFTQFWDKYTILGTFADHWFGNTPISRIPVHLQSRDVVAGGNRALAESFFRRVFMIEDTHVLATLLEAGICERHALPAFSAGQVAGLA
jgi:hypothetical protein